MRLSLALATIALAACASHPIPRPAPPPPVATQPCGYGAYSIVALRQSIADSLGLASPRVCAEERRDAVPGAVRGATFKLWLADGETMPWPDAPWVDFHAYEPVADP